MYDPTVTARQVEAANRSNHDRAIADGRSAPRELYYYDDTTRARAILHFQSAYDPIKKIQLRPLNPDEQYYIANERQLCAIDFYYWAFYAKIISWDKSSVSFTPNVAQRMVLDIWAEMERQAFAISMIQLKARQLGVTTLTEMAVAHRMQFHPRTTAIVASAAPDKSWKAAGMIDYCWKNMPWWLMPQVSKIQRGMPVEFAELNNRLAIQAGNQFTGVARGDTPNVAHLTELAEWEDPEQLVDAALLRAMHETPDLFVVLESTAFGRGNWWHRKYLEAKANWSSGRARLRPLFLPWFVGTDLYPSKTWIRTRPVPHDWEPSDLTTQHAQRARESVLSNPLLKKFLANNRDDWTLPREQQWYYEVERQSAKEMRQLNLFLSEMPANDHEAFQSTNISAIDSQVILDYRERCRVPLGVYTIIGDGIPDALVISRREWDLTKPRIPIRCHQLMRTPEVYWLQPLIFRGFDDTDPMLKLFIWEWPEDLETYGVGVDTSEGLGLDRSVIQGVRKASLARCESQIFEFASDRLHASQLWPMTLALSCLYSTYQQLPNRRVQCRVAIECRGMGELVQLEMKKRGWINFHPWMYYDKKKFPQPKLANREGVFTNQYFRSMMMDSVLTMIDEQVFDCPSPWLIDEFEALERDEMKQKTKAAYGEFDDRFLALGFASFSLHVLDQPGKQFARGRQSLPTALDPVDPNQSMPYATYRPPDQARDIPGRAQQRLLAAQRYGGGGTRLQRVINPKMPRGFQ